ncbi:hypothetical protein PsorP6_001610 [Peronosclerospora sorghi]|uniref:Uncharacterized protein n=1 Tax=Peronosclerospora sorghi TaxID=230839 RepID=A0ACC0X032_9STRA|nr:hypothetical protein PsorP6_001610 [Peronosclerospora sorghi]
MKSHSIVAAEDGFQVLLAELLQRSPIMKNITERKGFEAEFLVRKVLDFIFINPTEGTKLKMH